MTEENESGNASMEAELNKLLAGDMPLKGLSVSQTGPLHYTVLSTRNDGATAHRVNIQTLECSCKDMEYNKNLTVRSEGGREICAHIAYALVNHPQMNVDEQATYKSMALMEEASSLKDQLDLQLSRFEEALVELRDASAGVSAEASAETSEEPESPSSPDTVANAEDKAKELESAYNDVVEDMQVQAAEGYVWVQTGQETPENLEGPGNVSVFDAFLKNPDQVEFIHDEHEAVGQKPGEWWKNRINPDEVDEYIAEVLK